MFCLFCLICEEFVFCEEVWFQVGFFCFWWMVGECCIIGYGSGGKGDVILVMYEKDEVYGMVMCWILVYMCVQGDFLIVDFWFWVVFVCLEVFVVLVNNGDFFGLEVVECVQMMVYEWIKLIQQEFLYIYEEVVEYRVYDYCLYIGMWIVVGISVVIVFFMFDLMYLVILGVVVVFVLMFLFGCQY